MRGGVWGTGHPEWGTSSVCVCVCVCVGVGVGVCVCVCVLPSV